MKQLKTIVFHVHHRLHARADKMEHSRVVMECVGCFLVARDTHMIALSALSIVWALVDIASLIAGFPWEKDV